MIKKLLLLFLIFNSLSLIFGGIADTGNSNLIQDEKKLDKTDSFAKENLVICSNLTEELCNENNLCEAVYSQNSFSILNPYTWFKNNLNYRGCSSTQNTLSFSNSNVITNNNFDNLLVYFPFEDEINSNSKFLDYSGNGYTAQSDDGISNPIFKENNGLDGTNALAFSDNDLSITNDGSHLNINVNHSLTQYSKVAWVFVNSSITSGHNNIISPANTVGGSGAVFWIINDAGVLKLSGGHDGDWTALKSDKSFPVDQWVHVAITYDGSNLIIYQNGVEDKKISYTNNPNEGSMEIGGYISGIFSFDGMIDELYVFNDALTSSEIYELYEKRSNTGLGQLPIISDSYPFKIYNLNAVQKDGLYLEYNSDEIEGKSTYSFFKTDSKPVFFLPFDESINSFEENKIQDISGNNNHGELRNNYYPSLAIGQGPYGSNAYNFGSASELKTINFNNVMPENGGPYTKMAWVKFNSLAGNIISSSLDVSGTGGGHAFYVSSSSKSLCLGHNNQWCRDISYDLSNLNIETWHHFTGVYDGSNFYLYIDGVLVDSGQASNSYTDRSAGIGSFRGQSHNIASSIDGLIDDPILFDRALDQIEINSIYESKKSDILSNQGITPGIEYTLCVLFTNLQQTLVNNLLCDSIVPKGYELRDTFLYTKEDINTNYDIIKTSSNLVETITIWNINDKNIFDFVSLFSKNETSSYISDYSNDRRGSFINSKTTPKFCESCGVGGSSAYIFEDSQKDDIQLGNILNTNSYTKSIWFYKTNHDVSMNFISTGLGATGPNHRGAVLYWSPDSGLSAGHDGVWNQVSYNRNPSNYLNRWVHAAVTYDGSFLRLYLDGVEVDNFTTSNNPDNGFQAIGSFTKDNINTQNYMQGRLDDPMIFNKALSPEQIKLLFQRNYTTLSKTIVSNGDEIGGFLYSVSDSMSKKSLLNKIKIKENSINIISPKNYQIFQRNNLNLGEISIIGNYSGFLSGLEYSYDGSPYAPLEFNRTISGFQASLSKNIGQGNLNIRFANDKNISKEISNVGIGDIFVIAGQSNAEFRGSNFNFLNDSNQFIASVYMENDTLKKADDPLDSESSNYGTPYPELVNLLYQHKVNVPFMFITTAKGGTCINQWQPKGNSYGNYYEIMKNQINEITNRKNSFKAMLWFQGECDSRSDNYATSYSLKGNKEEYKEKFKNFYYSLNNDFTFEYILSGHLGSYSQDSAYPVERYQNIRSAQQDLWIELPKNSPGPITYDLGPLADGLHFTTDKETKIIAQRWFSALYGLIYNSSYPLNEPYVSKQTIIDENTIALDIVSSYGLNSGTGSQGWRVTYDGLSYSYDNGLTTSYENNKLYLNLPFTIQNEKINTLHLEYAYGRSGQNVKILRDNSKFNLPLQPYIN